ncbi:MAG: transcription antitermination factor NusB [Desulfobulbaceae bacterium]|jgi:N utilization substance protein B|nr:transcription antitermination factor NusB [Desulfobulbaceae bacterium]
MATVIGRRRKAREAALQFLFQEDFLKDALPPECLPGRFTKFCDHFEIGAASREYALYLVAEYRAQAERVDLLISQAASNWRLPRIAAVDRNLLRLAVGEMLVQSAPDQVVINEAVDIAKRFGDVESPSFVNGVLDAVRSSLRAA